jgi:GPH family glycoside/pentoside/hexuronide:cation symporter
MRLRQNLAKFISRNNSRLEHLQKRHQCHLPGARKSEDESVPSTREAATAKANIQAELNRKTHLNRIQKLIYGSGALADGMANTALGLLFFYMTAVCGLSGTLAGASFVIALLVDSVADPLIGSLSDNTQTRFGRRHPWMLAAALPLLISLGMLFSAPSMLKDWGLFVYMTAAAVGTRIALSLFAVPHVALGAELSDDYTERSHIVAYRTIFSVLSAILGPILIFKVFTHSSTDLLQRSGYTPFAWVSAGIAAASAVLCTMGTREMLSRLHVVEPGRDHPLKRFAREMAEIFRNRNFIILFLGSLLYFTSQGIMTQLSLHNAEFFWKFSNGILISIQIAQTIGAVAGFPLSSYLQRFIDKHYLLVITLVLICIGQTAVPVLRILDVLPASGLGLMIPVLVLNALNGTAQVIVGVTYYSLTADAADEHEYLFHARREGLFFAGLAFSSKAANALGAFIAGIALDWIGFPSAIAEKGAHLHIPARTIIELALIYGPGASFIMALPALLVFMLDVDRNYLFRIQNELSERRKAASALAGQYAVEEVATHAPGTLPAIVAASPSSGK